MKFLLLSAVVFSVVLTANACARDPYVKYRKSTRSDAVDDASATAKCQKDETLIACRCERFASDPQLCDGTNIKETADGFECVARNSAFGKGVVPVALCAQVVITCESDYAVEPEVNCPDDYRPMSCTMHTSFIQKYDLEKPNSIPQSKRSGNRCFTSKPCTAEADSGLPAGCKVQARCIRVTDFLGEE